MSYSYDADGLRTSRIAGSNKYYYYYHDGLLTYMKYNSLVMRFTYDAQGRPVSMTYNGNTYYYALNLQGDVMALLDANGNEVVSYHYNAWGEIISTTASTTGMLNTLAKYNPLRYRGYVYDRETGLYYLQSRYYNPEICRFISPDDVSLIGANDAVISHNLYAYCSNNPVTRADDNGEFWNIVIGAAAGALISGAISFASQVLEDGIENVDWGRVGVAAIAGAASGALAATGVLVGGQIIGNAAIGAASSLADTYLQSDGQADALEYIKNASISAGLGALGGLIGGNGTGTKHLTKQASNALKRTGNALSRMNKTGFNGTIKEISKAGKYYYSQIAKASFQCGMDAIIPIAMSNIPNAFYSIWG